MAGAIDREADGATRSITVRATSADDNSVIAEAGAMTYMEDGIQMQTGADGGLSEAWTSEPDHWAVIDIATTPEGVVVPEALRDLLPERVFTVTGTPCGSAASAVGAAAAESPRAASPTSCCPTTAICTPTCRPAPA